MSKFGKRAWHHPYPRFVNPDGTETLAGEILRLCAREEGMLQPWARYDSTGIVRRRSMVGRLNQLGLIVELRTGPRNGKYWHTTELGDVLATLAADLPPPAFRAALSLLF